MHERVQSCHDPETEFALLRGSLGVSRINHILRVHGHTIRQEKETANIFSTTEATRGHHACGHAVSGVLKLADPGITTEPRGLAEAQSRLADLFTAAAVMGRSAAPDACVASSNAAAARGATFEFKASSIASWFGQQTVDNTHPNPTIQQTLQHAATFSKCQPKPSGTDGNTKFKQPSSDEEQP